MQHDDQFELIGAIKSDDALINTNTVLLDVATMQTLQTEDVIQCV